MTLPLELEGGISSASVFTTDLKERLQDMFLESFVSERALLLSWGSTARGEMGPYSDLDLLLLFDVPMTEETEVVRTEFVKLVSNGFRNRVDLLDAPDLHSLGHIASVDGTDRQAVLLAEPLCGDGKLKVKFQEMQAVFFKQKRENVRELIHTYLTMQSVAENLFPLGNNVKFSKGRIRYLNFIYLATRLFFDDNGLVRNTVQAIDQLSKSGIIDESARSELKAHLDMLISVRKYLQDENSSEENTIPMEILSAELIQKIDARSALATKVCGKLVSRVLLKESEDWADLRRIECLLRADSSWSDTLAGEIGQPSDSMVDLVTTYKTNDPELLEIIRQRNLDDWYVLYGIANNQRAKPSTLHKLLCGEEGFSEGRMSRYKGFEWRNMLLYVAKNRSTEVETLQFIIDSPRSRPMDVLAAKTALTTRCGVIAD